MSKKYKPSKKQRRKWWDNQTPEQKDVYLKAIFLKKAENRRNKTLTTMAKYGNKYSCDTCLHKKTGSCDADYPQGCEDWTDGDKDFKTIERKNI